MRSLPAVLVAVRVRCCRRTREIYKCVDTERHQANYTESAADTKGCKKVEHAGHPTIPPPPPERGAADAPRQTVALRERQRFPEGSTAATQKARDNDRRADTDSTSSSKRRRKKLAELKKEYTNGEPDRRGDERNYAKYQERVRRTHEGRHRAHRKEHRCTSGSELAT